MSWPLEEMSKRRRKNMSSQPKRRLLMRLALSAVASIVLTGAPLSQSYAAPLMSILFVNPLPQYPAWRLIGDCIAEDLAD
jgi:hypothetical protein